MLNRFFEPTDDQLQKLRIASNFASKMWDSKQQMCQTFIASYPLDTELSTQNIEDLIQDYTLDEDYQLADEAGVMQGLRKLRNLLMLRWIWQDALNLISVETLTQELSNFADGCIKFAKEYTFNNLIKRYGRPSYKDENGEHQYDDMAIFAMGKLGANELNLSSDIDLIFVHQKQGYTDTAGFEKAKEIDNKRFMVRLGQGIIKLLDSNTADGFVFRVDMRLRPWGDGSDLAIHLSALDKYFAQHGRDWERFAWMKARVVNDIDEDYQQKLNEITKPFVFRHYVDYSMFAALREMKSMIQTQVAQREDLSNVKLGAGGIRDIEFIVQAFQLIYGGHYQQLQIKTCLKAMKELNKCGFFEDETYRDLKSAYLFLRRLEHAIQAVDDQQTQKLPSESQAQQNMAITLGYQHWDELMLALNEHRQKVIKPFDELVTTRQHSDEDSSKQQVSKQVENLNDILTDDNKKIVDNFWHSKLVAGLTDEVRERLEQAYGIFMPALIEYQNTQGDANIAVPRLINLLESICRRSIYLVMLVENPEASVNLIPMLAASPWVANELCNYPVLLDSFLQERYHHLPDKAELKSILQQRLLRVEADDEETMISVLRLFKKMQVLAVAASDVIDHHHIMKISDSLTFIAEVVLEASLQRAFSQLVKRHGYPISKSGEPVTEANSGFAIIGYGKLGGIELSYSSDLDLVFIHQIKEQAMTTGEKPISGMKFAARLAQKLMTYLSSQTRDGKAYEIDMRLRPSGNAGMMVVSAHAFELYQLKKAWEWEHQALVRARAICGDKKVMNKFDSIRHLVLSQPRNLEDVKKAVSSMRVKMQDHLGSNQQTKKAGKFHLKQDAGGIVDIEFIAQFAILAFAHDKPALTKWSDNVRIFEALAQNNVWSEQRCNQLTESYLKIRTMAHQLALSGKKLLVKESDWHDTRELVIRHWDEVIGQR